MLGVWNRHRVTKLFEDVCFMLTANMLLHLPPPPHPTFLLILSMELSSFFHNLHLSSSQSLLPSQTLPPITDFLSELQKKLASAPSDSETLHLIGRVENLFRTADPDWLFFSPSAEWAELQAVAKTLVNAAALPLCEDDCSSLPAAAYQSIPCRAVAVCSALSALLGAVGNRAAQTGLPLTLAPTVLVFAVTHLQVRVNPEHPTFHIKSFILKSHLSCSSQDQLWTNSDSRAAARNLQEVLLRAGGWRDPAQLLTGGNNGILGRILDILQPQMTKLVWVFLQ